jgi:hypothetical protein
MRFGTDPIQNLLESTWYCDAPLDRLANREPNLRYREADTGKVNLTMKSVLLLFLSAWFSNITSTNFVDGLEPLLAANRDAYLSGPRTPQLQQSALLYFDQQWAWLKSSAACRSSLLGQAGQRCVSDRSRAGSWSWEVYYRDPIVNNHL